MKRKVTLFRLVMITILILSIICSIKLLWDSGVALDESFSYRKFFDRNILYIWISAIGFPLSALLNVLCTFWGD